MTGDLDKALEMVLAVFEQQGIASSLVARRLDLALESINLLKEGLTTLTERVADLEHTIAELPNLGKVLGAVQELQELHDAPAAKFTHYISGGRGQ